MDGPLAYEFCSTNSKSGPSSATECEERPLNCQQSINLERTMTNKLKAKKMAKSGSSPPKNKPTLRQVLTLLLKAARPDKSKMARLNQDLTEESPAKTVSPTSNVDGGKVIAAPYNWPITYPLDKTNTALVIIDMQVDFCAPGGYITDQGYSTFAAQHIIPNVVKLLQTFRSLDMPVYFTREGHRPDLSTLSAREHLRSRNNETGRGIGDRGPKGRLLVRGEEGWKIIPELGPIKEEHCIDKPGRSAFQHTEFQLMLSIKGIKNLVICGVTTDVCVFSTMREANDNAFDCVLVEDACAASEPHLHDGAVASIKAEGGIFGAVTQTEDLIVGLVRLESPPTGLTSTTTSPAEVSKQTSLPRPNPLREHPVTPQNTPIPLSDRTSRKRAHESTDVEDVKVKIEDDNSLLNPEIHSATRTTNPENLKTEEKEESINSDSIELSEGEESDSQNGKIRSRPATPIVKKGIAQRVAKPAMYIAPKSEVDDDFIDDSDALKLRINRLDFGDSRGSRPPTFIKD